MKIDSLLQTIIQNSGNSQVNLHGAVSKTVHNFLKEVMISLASTGGFVSSEGFQFSQCFSEKAFQRNISKEEIKTRG